MKKIYLALIAALFMCTDLMSQNSDGAIKVVLKDKSTGETIPFANVVAYRDGVQIAVATTDIDGEAVIKPLTPGKYAVKGVYIGYQAAEITGILVGEAKTAYVTVNLPAGSTNIEEVVVTEYQVPLIDPDMKSGSTMTREEYNNLAVKDINSAVATSAGVYQSDNGAGISIRGGRYGSTTYFVDGVKVFGVPNLPQQAIEQLNVITGGVPANYGDLTSGAVSITTRGPQSKFFGAVELVSSQLTDPYGYNMLNFTIGGPIWKKRDSTRRVVLGYMISGQGSYIKETNPSFVPIYVLNEDKMADLRAVPLVPSPSGVGYLRAAEFVTKADMHTQKYRPNVAERKISVTGKLDFQPADGTNISWGNYFEFDDNNVLIGGNQLFNSDNNPRSVNQLYRTSLTLNQRIGSSTTDKNKTQSLVTNSFFKFQVSYENNASKVEDPRHKKNFFNYGYIGKFDIPLLEENYAYNYNYTPDYVINGVAANAYTYTGRQQLPVKFTPSDLNPDATNYTSYLMSVVDQNKFFVSQDLLAAFNGLRNGDAVPTIYGLYNNMGAIYGGYYEGSISQFRVMSSFNADVKKHALSVGFEFDQRNSRQYSLSTTQLWRRMRQLANVHTSQLDLNNPHLNEQLSGTVNYYYFDYLYEKDRQTQFSERLLDKLGLPRNYTGFVNTDMLDPSQLSIDMFSADDLLSNNASSSLVSYYGYSHDGKKTTGKVDINKFLNEKDAEGRNTLPIGSFQPIYAAVYVMDRFDFKDIKFNVGLRVDRYDANQPVLKDKYLLHEGATVSDLGSMENLPPGFSENVPGNVSKDAVVYVAQNPSGGKSPLAIRGYREGDRWFNAEGAEVSDPNLIAAADGRPIPLLKDRSDYDKKMTVGAFTNYKAVIIPQPRVAFSFPISDVSNFFAHYDITVQRPNNSVINPLDYYFMNASSTTPFVNNPNQKPQRSIEYELGFAQVLNERKNAVLKLTSFYKEMRNMINTRVVVGAYPKNYIMYDNIDFGTSKGITAEFDFRRTGGSRFNLNYTLLFAEGSGSNANSGANLASSGQPNLRILTPLDYDQRHTLIFTYDYRFGAKKDYKGPEFKNKKDKTVHVFEDVGFNLQMTYGSGTPYTRWSTAVPTQGGNGRSSIQGQINGSSKPSIFRANLRIDKNIALTFNKDDDAKKKYGNLNIYLQVMNLFNSRNVNSVYNFTGAPDDDGYLSSTQAQAALAQANSAVAYSDMYRISMNNPFNYSTPRQIRIGLLFDFQ
jgi:hypothetical protein